MQLNLTAGEEVDIEYEVDGWFYVSKTSLGKLVGSCRNYHYVYKLIILSLLPSPFPSFSLFTQTKEGRKKYFVK